MKIENAKTLFFNSKEDYLTFRKNWAAACNSNERKSTLVDTNWGRIRKPGFLTATHHYIFLLLCGKDVLSGFKPITNTTKLSNGMKNYTALYAAFEDLGYIARKILSVQRESSAKDKEKSWVIQYNKDIDNFLKPFGGSVTREMVEDLDRIGKAAWHAHWDAVKAEKAAA